MSKYDLKQEVTDKYSLRGRVFNKIREDILSGKYIFMYICNANDREISIFV